MPFTFLWTSYLDPLLSRSNTKSFFGSLLRFACEFNIFLFSIFQYFCYSKDHSMNNRFIISINVINNDNLSIFTYVFSRTLMIINSLLSFHLYVIFTVFLVGLPSCSRDFATSDTSS